MKFSFNKCPSRIAFIFLIILFMVSYSYTKCPDPGKIYDAL